MESQNSLTKSLMEGFENILLTQTQFTTQRRKVFLEDNLKYGKEIERDYNKLQDIIDNLQAKVDKIIKSQEDDFMIAYKEQMAEIQKELKAMKRKIDEETLRQNSDEKKRILEEERDYFREEALRLDKLCQEQIRTIEELKFKLKITQEEKQYYECFVIDSKKENKALKQELLQLYKQKSEEQRIGQRVSSVGDINQKTVIKKNIDYRTFTQEGTQFTAIKDEQGEISKREFSSNKSGQKTQLSSKIQDYGSSQHDIFRREMSSQQRSRYNQDIQQIQDTTKQEQIQELRSQLQKEKQINQLLKAELSKYNCQKGELEQILIDCVNEMKKEVQNRQSQQKQFFQHRPTSYSQPNIEGEKQYSQFTHTDKIQLLKRFISSDEFLNQLYQITFNNQMQLSTQLKLNEKWKIDADEAAKKFYNFKQFKYRYKTSQPILKTSLIKRQDKEVVQTSSNYNDKTRELIDQIIKVDQS
ncbi:unnamed protein product [Paramecium octaurelia]|uniref:Uncharacterized protein n=1 Tax=Paramecium octaurelia TaxID=43137 RepID=A0A8S1VR16_PAROT|nr:unnamed protein product [Paramecium octaurelia]